jgi:putative PIN family toxin of toxin-antitoxin system
MPNAVFDSTVLVSAFLTRRGVAAVLLRHTNEGAFSAFLSEEILAETQSVLLDETRRIRQRYHYPNESVHLFIEGLRDIISVVTDLPSVTVVTRDPKDDIVIATALKAQVSHIITRDDDLLSLREYEGITMITPEAFMRLLREQGLIGVTVASSNDDI